MKKLTLLLAAALLVSTPAAAFDEAEVRVKCMNAVRNSARVPSSVDFDRWSTECRPAPNRSLMCMGQVEMKNGFGVMLPHVWGCIVAPDGSIDALQVMQR